MLGPVIGADTLCLVIGLKQSRADIFCRAQVTYFAL